MLSEDHDLVAVNTVISYSSSQSQLHHNLRILENWPELLAICGCCHDTCVHGVFFPNLSFNASLHLKRLEFHAHAKTIARSLPQFAFILSCFKSLIRGG